MKTYVYRFFKNPMDENIFDMWDRSPSLDWVLNTMSRYCVLWLLLPRRLKWPMCLFVICFCLLCVLIIFIDIYYHIVHQWFFKINYFDKTVLCFVSGILIFMFSMVKLHLSRNVFFLGGGANSEQIVLNCIYMYSLFIRDKTITRDICFFYYSRGTVYIQSP